MASRDPDEIVVAGTGDLWIAPVGTALPATEVAALNGVYEKLGYTTEDGVTFQSSVEVQEFMAWQSISAVRRSRTSREDTISCQLEQWNDSNFMFAWGGGEITEPTPGHFKFTPPLDDDALEEKTLIVDFADGDKVYRWVVPRGTITEAVETVLSRSDMSVLPVGFKALQPADGSAPWQLLTNDPAFDPDVS